MSYTQRFEDPRSFEAWNRAKKHQEANMEEYPVFSEQIESQ
jgi:hypothetical protein